MPTERHAGRSWRQVLRAVRAARDAAYFGPRTAGRAAAAHLSGANPATRIATAAVLASQGAKNEFITDIATFWRELAADEMFHQEMRTTQIPVVRRRPTQHERRDPLPVEAARAVPILDLFERYGHQVRRVGTQWVTRCPFHDDQRPSLTLSPSKGLWYCHPCGIGGDGIGYVMQRKGLDFAAAVRELAA